MADRELTSNVEVDGVWYGPSYPNNKVTAEVREKITNEAAYEPLNGNGIDLRFTAADFAVQEAGEQVHLRGNEDAFAFQAAVPAPDAVPSPPMPEGNSVNDAAQGQEPRQSLGTRGDEERQAAKDEGSKRSTSRAQAKE